MTAIKTTSTGPELKLLVRYQVQARPELTRLVIEFKESQHELLRQFMDLLLQAPNNNENREDEDHAPETANGDKALASTTRGCATNVSL